MGNKVTEAAKAAKERVSDATSKAAESARKKQPKVVKEFAEFINKGNIVDLAVGVVIGGAFGKIVTALVDYIIMPLVGMVLGGVDFSDLYIRVPNWLGDGRGVLIQYGNFLQAVVDFLVIAFCVFIFVKFINKFRINFKKEIEEASEAAPSDNDKIIALLEDIKKNTTKK